MTDLSFVLQKISISKRQLKCYLFVNAFDFNMYVRALIFCQWQYFGEHVCFK